MSKNKGAFGIQDTFACARTRLKGHQPKRLVDYVCPARASPLGHIVGQAMRATIWYLNLYTKERYFLKPVKWIISVFHVYLHGYMVYQYRRQWVVEVLKLELT